MTCEVFDRVYKPLLRRPTTSLLHTTFLFQKTKVYQCPAMSLCAAFSKIEKKTRMRGAQKRVWRSSMFAFLLFLYLK
jgi:hypothetical protein